MHFVVFLLISFFFKLVCDKVSLNVEFISITERISSVSLIYSSAFLTFRQKEGFGGCVLLLQIKSGLIKRHSSN